MASNLVYSTSTEHGPAAQVEDYADPYCFVCSRATDHLGEHDDLVDAGLARYDAPYVKCGSRPE